MVLRHAVRGQNHDMGGAASSKLAEYASLLASQGKLETALAYLPTASSDVSPNASLIEMIYHLSLSGQCDVVAQSFDNGSVADCITERATRLPAKYKLCAESRYWLCG